MGFARVMSQVHPQTLLIALAIEYISLTLVTLPALRIWPKDSGMARWSVGNACLAVAMALLSERGVAPGLLTVVLANGLLIFGADSVHVSVRHLYNAPLRPLWQRLLPLACWATLSLLWALDPSPGQLQWAGGRVAAFALALLWSAGGTCYALLRRAPRPWSLGTWYVFVAMLMPVAGQASRSFNFAHAAPGTDPVLALNSAVPLYSAFAACGVFMTYGFFLLLNDQLQAQLQAANARLREDAATDPLTQIANRRQLETIAATEISRAHRYRWPLTVLLLDLDHFKRVNDLFGHAVGDEVLRAVAEVCRKEVRGHDLVARIGGEEFAVLLPHCDLRGGETMARRLAEQIRDMRVDLLDGAVVTVSIGIASLLETERTLGPLLQRADRALYRAKTAGRDRVSLDESLT